MTHFDIIFFNIILAVEINSNWYVVHFDLLNKLYQYVFRICTISLHKSEVHTLYSKKNMSYTTYYICQSMIFQMICSFLLFFEAITLAYSKSSSVSVFYK